MIIKVKPGEKTKIPLFYGVAWHDIRTDTLFVYPLLINLLMRWARNTWYYIKYGN